MKHDFITHGGLAGIRGILTIAAILGLFWNVPAQAQSNDANALALYQTRLTAIEQTLKDINARLENELFELENELSAMRERLSELTNPGNLTNEIRSLSGKMERTLQMASDNEFRILQLDARLQTLMRISADLPANTAPHVAVDENGVSGGTLGASGENGTGTAPPVAQSSLTAPDDGSGSTDQWVLQRSVVPETDGAQAGDTNASAGTGGEAQAEAELEATAGQEATTSLLEGSEEEQFDFAVDLALKNRLEEAEAVFAEFVSLHTEGTRSADALFWLGRIQFMQGAYQKASISFSDFTSKWPNDPRQVEAKILIAESVAEFVPADDACNVFERIPGTLDNPPEKLMLKLEELKAKVGCDNL